VVNLYLKNYFPNFLICGIQSQHAATPITAPNKVTKWYRGITKPTIEGQDTFWTSDKSIAVIMDCKSWRRSEYCHLKPKVCQDIYHTTNKELLQMN